MAISTPSIRKVHVTAPIEEICKVLREDGVVGKGSFLWLSQSNPVGLHVLTHLVEVVTKYAPEEFVDALNAEAYPVFEAVRQKGNPKHVAQGKKEFRPAVGLHRPELLIFTENPKTDHARTPT